jgi:hypothetical protein
MVNIILVALLVHLIITYFFKPNYDTLNCGIWGFHGKTNKKFKWDKFNILGIMNDPRGGDAAGRMIGKYYEHFNSSPIKKYTDIVVYRLNPDIENETTIFGHTRKTSANAKLTMGIEYTQPFAIRDENDNIIGMGLHNGTLYNKEELMKKYNVPEKLVYYDKGKKIEHAPNDSQVLLWTLLVKKDYSILEEYQGGAALAWYDFRDSTLKLFRGESPMNKYSNDNEEERPLYIYEGRNNIWFSSVENSLYVISEEAEPNIEEIEANTVLTFKEGKLVDDFHITRKNIQGNGFLNYNHSYDYDDYWYNNYGGYSNWNMRYKSKNTQSTTIQSNSTNKALPSADDKISLEDNRIVFVNGRYKIKDKIVHGIYHVNSLGYIVPNDLANSSYHKVYYFIDGIMVKDHKSFRKYNKKYKKFYTDEVKNRFLAEKVIKIALHPVLDLRDNKYYEWNPIIGERIVYNGMLYPVFSKVSKLIRGGRESVATVADYRTVTENEGQYYPEDFDDFNKALEYDCSRDEDVAEKYYEEVFNSSDEEKKEAILGSDYSTEKDNNDYLDSMEDELTRKEIAKEIVNVVSFIDDTIDDLYVYPGVKLAEDTIELLNNFKEQLSEIG